MHENIKAATSDDGQKSKKRDWVIRFGFVGIFFFLLVGIFSFGMYARGKQAPEQVLVSTVGSNTFTISFFTEWKTNAELIVSDNPSFEDEMVFYDERDYISGSKENFQGRTGHVLIARDLEPEKEYYYKIQTSLNGYDASGKTITTASADKQVPVPEPVFGEVLDSDSSPKKDILIEIFKEDSAGKRSSTVVTYTTDNGTYSADLANLRDLETREYYQSDDENIKVVIVARNLDEAYHKVAYAGEYTPVDSFVFEKALDEAEDVSLANDSTFGEKLFSPVEAQELSFEDALPNIRDRIFDWCSRGNRGQRDDGCAELATTIFNELGSLAVETPDTEGYSFCYSVKSTTNTVFNSRFSSLRSYVINGNNRRSTVGPFTADGAEYQCLCDLGLSDESNRACERDFETYFQEYFGVSYNEAEIVLNGETQPADNGGEQEQEQEQEDQEDQEGSDEDEQGTGDEEDVSEPQGDGSGNGINTGNIWNRTADYCTQVLNNPDFCQLLATRVAEASVGKSNEYCNVLETGEPSLTEVVRNKAYEIVEQNSAFEDLLRPQNEYDANLVTIQNGVVDQCNCDIGVTESCSRTIDDARGEGVTEGSQESDNLLLSVNSTNIRDRTYGWCINALNQVEAATNFCINLADEIYNQVGNDKTSGEVLARTDEENGGRYSYCFSQPVDGLTSGVGVKVTEYMQSMTSELETIIEEGDFPASYSSSLVINLVSRGASEQCHCDTVGQFCSPDGDPFCQRADTLGLEAQICQVQDESGGEQRDEDESETAPTSEPAKEAGGQEERERICENFDSNGDGSEESCRIKYTDDDTVVSGTTVTDAQCAQDGRLACVVRASDITERRSSEFPNCSTVSVGDIADRLTVDSAICIDNGGNEVYYCPQNLPVLDTSGVVRKCISVEEAQSRHPLCVRLRDEGKLASVEVGENQTSLQCSPHLKAGETDGFGNNVHEQACYTDGAYAPGSSVYYCCKPGTVYNDAIRKCVPPDFNRQDVDTFIKDYPSCTDSSIFPHLNDDPNTDPQEEEGSDIQYELLYEAEGVLDNSVPCRLNTGSQVQVYHVCPAETPNYVFDFDLGRYKCTDELYLDASAAGGGSGTADPSVSPSPTSEPIEGGGESTPTPTLSESEPFLRPNKMYNEGDKQIFKRARAQNATPNGIETQHGDTLEPGTYQLPSGATIEIVSPTKIKFFVDSNGNGVRDQGEAEVEDLVIQLTQARNFDYQFNEGWNTLNLPGLKNQNAFYTASELFAIAEGSGVTLTTIKSWSKGAWEEYALLDGQNYNGSDMDVIPNQGYFIYAENAGEFTIKTTTLSTSYPQDLISGWNLVGVGPGYTDTGETVYLNEAFNDGMGALEYLNTVNNNGGNLNLNNITRWDSGVYRGVNLIDNKEFGLDFDVIETEAYFVRSDKKGIFIP